MLTWLATIKSSDSFLWQHLLKLSIILLTFYLCWRLAALFWLVLVPPQAMQITSVALGSKQTQIPNITSFALFQEVNTIDSKSEQIPLILQGVVVGLNAHSSSAVIKVNETAERYRVGEQISDTGYQLSEVHWDRIVLRNINGAVREVMFVGLPNGLNEPMVPAQMEDVVLSESSMNEPIDSTELHIREAALKFDSNSNQYLQDMGLKATSDGLEMTAKTPAIIRQKLGLQLGDRIMSLNGKTISAGQNEMQLLEQLRQQGQAKIEIKRGDQVMTIQQDFR